MHEIVYSIIAVMGILFVIIGNYLSLKNKTRKKFPGFIEKPHLITANYPC